LKFWSPSPNVSVTMVTTIGSWAWTAGTRHITPATGTIAMAVSSRRRFMRTNAIREDMGDPLFREMLLSQLFALRFGSCRHGNSYVELPNRIALSWTRNRREKPRQRRRVVPSRRLPHNQPSRA
jgi:hypothetical protein